MDHQMHGPGPAISADPGLSLQTLRHELRTPVNHIIGYSEMLLEEAVDLERPEPFAALHEVVAAGRTMLALINEHLSSESEARADALELFHNQLRPHLLLALQICMRLSHQAATLGLDSFVIDLARISAATTHLGDLAAGLHYQPAPAPLTSAEPSDEPATATAEAAAPREGDLLLVDDNPMNRDMLSRRLERLGYTLRQAEGGRQALDMLAAQPADLILLDIMMPEMDGYAVLAALKVDAALSRIPVIVLSALDDLESVVRAVELGADDYLPKPFDPVLLKARISACLFKKRMRDNEVDYLKRIEDEKRRADDLLHVVIPIGVALSVEKDFNQLLERIVIEAQALCNADGGTLYLRTDDHRLRFVIVRNRTLAIAMGGASGTDIPFPPLRLYDEQSSAPLYNYVVTHAALEGQTINIADAYHAEGYDFSGTRDFDARTGYRSTSILNIPLKDGLGRVIGVLQLINAQDEQGQVVAFDGVAEQMLESLGALAAAALAAYAREQQLRQEIANLRIEIDQVKKQREVTQITTSSYFTQLQEKARQLRAAAGPAPLTHDDTAEPTPPPAPRRERSSEIEHKIFTVAGHPIHARVQGPEHRRLLLLLHGWSSSWYALSPLLPILSDRYHCVAVDLPGYGESPPLPGRTTIPAYANLLAQLIAQLSPRQPAVLIGHSMGGMISLTMALRYAQRIERMVLICPTISGELSGWINWMISPITRLERSRIVSRIVSRLEPHMLRVTDQLMRPASFAKRSTISQHDYERLRADARRPGQGRVRAECYWAMRDHDLQGKLAAIDIPTLVLWGMEDNTVPLRDASVVADEWPQAELRVLPKAGHWPQFETLDQTKRFIRPFLSKPLKLLKADL